MSVTTIPSAFNCGTSAALAHGLAGGDAARYGDGNLVATRLPCVPQRRAGAFSSRRCTRTACTLTENVAVTLDREEDRAAEVSGSDGAKEDVEGGVVAGARIAAAHGPREAHRRRRLKVDRRIAELLEPPHAFPPADAPVVQFPGAAVLVPPGDRVDVGVRIGRPAKRRPEAGSDDDDGADRKDDTQSCTEIPHTTVEQGECH